MTLGLKITKDSCVEFRAVKVISRMRKLFCRGILALFGVGSLVTGISSAVYAANLTVLSQLESDFSTRSSESLIEIENRSHAKDYASIFSETKPITEWKPILLNPETQVSIVRIPTELLELINKVEVNTGGSSLDSDQLVKVRYRLDSM